MTLEMERSAEVRAAQRSGRPLVALETSVVVQGLPYPSNLEAARACEDAVRRAGATPAAIAIIAGRVHVGLEVEEMRALAEPGPGRWKLAARDLPVALAQGATGGTTVSATCELAAKAGIRIFSTGGIGGVHRGASEHWDVSQDLAALAQHDVAVVCAGAKSVLDLPKTLEVLETLGVPVIGVGTSELPSFYSRESGLRLEHSVDGAAAAAALLRARWEALGQRGGVLFTLPPPEELAIAREVIERELQIALAAAARQGVKGKAVTPFLLGELARQTQGKSLATNVALLVNNARFAGALAVAFASKVDAVRGGLGE